MISNEIIENYFYCPRKAYYKKISFRPEINSIYQLHSQIDNKIKKEIRKKWMMTLRGINSLGINFQVQDQIFIPFVLYTPERSKATPVFLTSQSKLQKEEKLTFSLITNLFQQRISKPNVEKYKVLSPSGKTMNFKVSETPDLSFITDQIKDKPLKKVSQHCMKCEFKNTCTKELKTEDDLRLLTGMKEAEVANWKDKGFFTVTQLSYKYRPRKNRNIEPSKRYLFELKSLAIREQKTLVRNVPELENSKNEIYIDFENIPDEKWVYLIGILIAENGTVHTKKSLWADCKEKEIEIFCGLFETISQYRDAPIYCYGNFELKELKRFNKEHNFSYSSLLEEIDSRTINLLSFFYSDIYTPTYSNGLKEIAAYVGFTWSIANCSGLISIVWRKKWELFKKKRFKNRLIQYNLDDCLALHEVKLWIKKLNSEKPQIKNLDQIATQSHLRFGRTNFVFSEFDDVNSTAYFDYQRSKVYLRTNKLIRRKQLKKTALRPKFNTVRTSSRPESCPKCSSSKINIHQKYDRMLIDLRFSKNGVKRWVTNFKSRRFRCVNCGYVFTDPAHYREPTYGRNLRVWIINNYMTYGVSYGNIVRMLKENFNVEVTRTFVSQQKKLFAEENRGKYQNIKRSILNGQIIHIDETSVKVKSKKAYVWVLTNMTHVYYIFRPNRETDFLDSYLEEFKGVLISDFYTGYDSFSCTQQKCLIHLIRDINDAVFHNPSLLDLCMMAEGFGTLMKRIIHTVDRYGLKQRNLRKHEKDVDQFYKFIVSQQIVSKEALKLRKRFMKNRDKLFAFLKFDGVPWNNNNAEHAIKAFAKYRRMANGTYNETGLNEYLTLLSISQTCHFQGISFLQYLRGEEQIENIA